MRHLKIVGLAALGSAAFLSASAGAEGEALAATENGSNGALGIAPIVVTTAEGVAIANSGDEDSPGG